MKYCITMERTLRIAVNFDAANDDEAREKASEIFDNTSQDDFEQGSEEYDYALCDDTGRTIVDWE